MIRNLLPLIALAFTSVAAAAIVPSWQVNPISPQMIAMSNGQLTVNSISISLMCTLSGSSLFDSAGLLIGQAQFPGIVFYLDNGGTTISHPPIGPFDTNLPLSIGQNGLFNVIWGSPSGSNGTLELARITIASGAMFGTTAVPGFVASATQQVMLPPAPIAPVPEPALASLSVAAAFLMRRSVRQSR